MYREETERALAEPDGISTAVSQITWLSGTTAMACLSWFTKKRWEQMSRSSSSSITRKTLPTGFMKYRPPAGRTVTR